ncbi:NLI interacting factor [Macleaya cordata]|uniref:NLI interacting factor n=1 Tax=Macleaya cordata TaxID=56857 RepID=A0A200RAN6_MACCD|nr:NLI interacting factor [Macleaya cordata]
MPALKMKTKPCTGCSREAKGLHVCHKSSKISKNSFSQVRLSQHTADLEASIENHHDVFSNIEVSQEIECDKAADHKSSLDGEACQSQKSPLAVVESPSVGRMEFQPATCLSNLETIFSPIFEFNENHCRPNIYNYAVKDDLDLAHLIAEDSDEASSSSYGYQTCNVSDFNISDMTVAGFPFDENTGFEDIMESSSFPDYGCSVPDTMLDMAERYMILPFLEETVETSNIHKSGPCEDALIKSDDVCLYLAIHQMKSCDEESDFNSHPIGQDDADCFDPHLFIRNLPDLSDVVPSLWPLLLPKETWKRKSITLVLDLDETLVHSTLEHCDDADFTFPVFFNMKEHTVYVRQRPYLQAFLERVAEMFEIIVFTASQSTYAEQLLNVLDPGGKLISRRAYRESCIFSDGSYTKDLTVLGVDLAKVAIIDNSPQVFQLQVNNGIPIKSWFDDPSDRALISLLPFLETLIDADDVRPIIAKRFSNNNNE